MARQTKERGYASPNETLVSNYDSRRYSVSPLVVLMSILMVVASVMRFPFLEEAIWFKALVQIAEVMTLVCGAALLAQPWSALYGSVIPAALVIGKCACAVLVAAILYNQEPATSILEARFGFALAGVVVVSRIICTVEVNVLRGLAACCLAWILTIDTTAVFVLGREGLLLLGERTDIRLMVSVAPLAALVFEIARRENPGKTGLDKTGVVMSAAMLFHSYFVSTSRLESLLCAALLFYTALSSLRGVAATATLLAFSSTAAIALTQYDSVPLLVGGRDYGASLDALQSTSALGVGYLRDETLRSVLRLSGSFFVSDFGFILYPIRYGVLGFAMVIALLCTVALAVARSFPTPEMAFALACAALCVFIPVLDYGGLSSIFLLATLAHLAAPREIHRRAGGPVID